MNEVARLNRYKSELVVQNNDLEAKMESRGLSNAEKTRMDFVAKELLLEKIWAFEEIIKDMQRSRDRNIFEGDKNTVYFHAVVNQSRKREWRCQKVQMV